jgi:hypothetical protein
MKNTQKDDREAFDTVIDQKDRILSRLNMTNSNRAEATRKLLVGAFAHQRANICGAPMSSYLTRNSERFIFSHETYWIPLRDLKSLLEGRVVSSSITFHERIPFFQCVALHFLTRPVLLEHCCSFDFFSKYEVTRLTKKNEEELMEFCNTSEFQHPSYRSNCNGFLQGVRQRKIPVLAKVFQYDFCDTAEFGSDILTCESISPKMEIYSELVLLMFHPFRTKEDLILNGSFTQKLRSVIASFKPEHLQFLQNVQDAKSNSFRNARLEDDLQRHTTTPKAADFEESHDALEIDTQEEDAGR